MDQLTPLQAGLEGQAENWSESDADLFVPENPWDVPPGMVEEELFGPSADQEGEDDRPATALDDVDFDDPVSIYLIQMLRRHVRDACNVNSKDGARRAALEWIFVPGRADKDGLEFEPLCQALCARPTVVRARTMHQMWRAGIILDEPLPEFAVDLPVDFASEIEARIGYGLPVDLARQIWRHPSVPVAALLSHGYAPEVGRALRALDAEGFVAAAHMRLYYVTRNPELMPLSVLRRFSFARSIHAAF